MKKQKRLNETAHRRTYNLLRKQIYAGCAYCKWHSTFYRRCCTKPFPYFLYEDDWTDKPEALKFSDHPNWKIVSKNRKQWMKKRFLVDRTIMADGSLLIRYGW